MLRLGPAGVKTRFGTLSTDNCIWAKTSLHTVYCLAYIQRRTLLIQAGARITGFASIAAVCCGSKCAGMLVHAQAGLQSRLRTFNVL